MSNVIDRKFVRGGMVVVDNLYGTAFTGEEDAHTFRITGYDVGVPAAITGEVAGKFVNPAGVTVPLSGSLDADGRALVTLDKRCYAVGGRFILTIWAGTAVIYCGVGQVMNSQTATIYYPTAAIPDVAALVEQLQEILDGWPADYSQIESDVEGLQSHFPATGKFQAGTGSATGNYSAAMGNGTTASASAATAEGWQTTASGINSHAEGYKTAASGTNSHAEGGETTASGNWGHAEGYDTVAGGQYSHAEGFHCQATGSMSHADGRNTRATHRAQHVFGSYNEEDPSEAASTENGTYLEIVGNGSDGTHRSNARTLDWNGNEELAGDVTVNKGGDNEMALGASVRDLKSAVSGMSEWLGYPKNVFDARTFAISNTSNWSIDSATQTAITITHKNEYSTGSPLAALNLPTGKYDFHADYTGSTTQFSFRVNGSWVKALTDGAEIEIDSSNTNEIYFSNSVAGTYTITEIGIIPQETTGKIPTIESEVGIIESDIDIAESNILDLQNGFSDITETVKSAMTGTTQTNKAINASGVIYAGGSDHYCIAKYDVTAGEKYWITANTNWGNLLWCFYNSADAVVQLGSRSASSSDDTIITDEEVTAPSGATYILISFNDTVGSAALKTETGYKIKGEWVGKKWVCVGDSLTAENIRTTKHYFDYVAEETGITTVNMGVSGSGYARMADTNNAFYQRISSCPTDADVVTIFGSFNDLGAGLPLGSVNDTGTDTLAGCINTTITNLQNVIPLVNLGIVAPTPWDTTQPTTSGSDYNYVEMLKAICERRSIPLLDLWRCSNLRPWDADFRELAYSKDGGSGTHPDETGHKLIAPRFKGFLETLLM